MLYYLTAAGLVAHTIFWGAGMAWLVVPKHWRRWAWTFAPSCGLALQSAVVWAGAHTSLAGTNSYAWGSELLPLALLAVAWRQGRVRWFPSQLRGSLVALALMIVAGWLLLSPLAERGAWTLTTSSLGSCDQADYAAGARVFQEFSKNDRTGFLGLPEVTRVRSTDYFFEYFVQQNHFTPSALIAHHAAIFGLQPYQLVSVTGVALLLLNLPLGLFLARALVGMKGVWLFAVGAIFLISPLNAYGVHHGALGQLLAMNGIALLTVAGFGARRMASRWARVWAFAPLVVSALWLLAGSYNFILVVAFAPLGTWLVLDAIQTRRLVPAVRVLSMLAASLAICAAIFPGRFVGLIERFSLFEEYSFGWPVPLLTPEGWLGLVRDTNLHAWPAPLRAAGIIVVAALWLGALVHGWTEKRRGWLVATALVLPVIGGWAVLVWESRVRVNASYDAYKVLMVFYPGLLAGLLGGLSFGVMQRGWWRRCAAVGLAGVVALNLVAAWQFRAAMKVPPLRVDRALLELAQLERELRVESLNLRVDDFWSRLWANALLLRKPHYFPSHTYEARLNTPLRGAWDLSDSLLRVVPLREEDHLPINARFFANRVGAFGAIDAKFADGWHAEERVGADRWRWAAGSSAQVEIQNAAAEPITARIAVKARSVARGVLRLSVGSRLAGEHVIDETLRELMFTDVVLPPGITVLTLQSDQPPVTLPGDGRALTFAVYGWEIRAVSRETGQPATSAAK